MLGPIAPVTVKTSARTLALAHEEEAATLATTILVGRVVERVLTLNTSYVSLGPIDSHLIGPATICQFTLAVDTLNSRSCQYVAGMPDTNSILAFASEQSDVLVEVRKLEMGELPSEGHELLHTFDKERHIDAKL